MLLRRAVIAAVILALGACTTQYDPAPVRPLPAATQTGANTAGAKVDGTVWLPAYEWVFIGKAIRASYYKTVTGYNLNVSLARITSEDDPYHKTSINFYVPDVRQVGTVTFEQTANPMLTTSNPAYATFSRNNPTPNEVLITGPAYPGQLTITRLDTVARIVAGTYAFQAKQLGGAATVRVTEGRFDVRY